MTTVYLLIHLGHHAEPVLYELRRVRDEVKTWEMTDRWTWLGRLERSIDFTIAHIEAAAELEANRHRFSPVQ